MGKYGQNFLKTMHKLIYLLAILFFTACSSEQLKLGNTNFQIGINHKGQIVSFYDLANKKEYFPKNQQSWLLSLRANGIIHHPSTLEWNNERTVLTLSFDKLNTSASIEVTIKETHTNFELLKVEGDSKPDLAIWGPFATTIKMVVGETIGVVRNNEFAIGIQALNPKTLGGYPTNEDDTEPSYSIFASNNLVDIGDSVKIM